MYCAECGGKLPEKYEEIANQIYEMLDETDPTYGDILGALELVKLWVTADFIGDKKRKPTFLDVG